MPKPEILIVDDDPSICSILRKILTNRGYAVTDVFNGRDGIDAFSKTDFDLVLLDLMLPDMDGIEVAREMMSENGKVPIILISAHGTIPKAVEATKQGVYDFFEKPFERERLLITIRNALSLGQTQQDLQRYKDEVLSRYQMIGQSKSMKAVYDWIEKVAPLDSSVMITGESGVGKELVAQAIHNGSGRANRQMLVINCSAIPEHLIESELFGHVRGAFTGAHTSRQGYFQRSDRSTLFLDEIGDLSMAAQAKLLRCLETGEIQRIGSTETSYVDVRVIAATNKDLMEMVEQKLFREDLYYRLEVFTVTIPPLRKRKADIPLLLDHFIETVAENRGMLKPQITQAAIRHLCSYQWPGNIRQLKNFVERMMAMHKNSLLDVEHVKAHLISDRRDTQIPRGTLRAAREDFEREYIATTLAECGGSVREAAKKLGLDRGNLYRKMRDLGMELE